MNYMSDNKQNGLFENISRELFGFESINWD